MTIDGVAKIPLQANIFDPGKIMMYRALLGNVLNECSKSDLLKFIKMGGVSNEKSISYY